MLSVDEQMRIITSGAAQIVPEADGLCQRRAGRTYKSRAVYLYDGRDQQVGSRALVAIGIDSKL